MPPKIETSRLVGNQAKLTIRRPESASPEAGAKSAEIVVAVNGQDGTIRRAHDLDSFAVREVHVLLPIPFDLFAADGVDYRPTGVDRSPVLDHRFDDLGRDTAMRHPRGRMTGQFRAVVHQRLAGREHLLSPLVVDASC